MRSLAAPGALLAALAAPPPAVADGAVQTAADAELERAAERRFRSAEQFYGGGRYDQALRDFEAVLEVMPESRLADDAALRIARHRFDVEGDHAAAGAMAERVLRQFPAGDAAPGAHLLLGELAAAGSPPRPDDALAEFERVLSAVGPSGSPWSFSALTGIAALLDARGDPAGAAGALLAALHEAPNEAPRAEGRILPLRLELARALARAGEFDAALAEIGGLRAETLEVARRGDGAGAFEAGAEALRLAESASALANLIFRFRGPGPPVWSFAGALRAPRPLRDPRRLRMGGGQLFVLDVDEEEVQVFRPDGGSGEFAGAYGVRDPRDLALAPAGEGGIPTPVVAAENTLFVGGNTLSLTVSGAGSRQEPLRRVRAVAAVPEGYWVWDDREKTVHRFSSRGDHLGRTAHPRLDDVIRISRHPAGHLVLIDEDQGVLGFDAEGRRVFHIPRDQGLEEPVDLAFDALGHLYILDAEGPTVAVHGRDFSSLTLLRGDILPGSAVREPVSLAVGEDGTIFILARAPRSVAVFR